MTYCSSKRVGIPVFILLAQFTLSFPAFARSSSGEMSLNSAANELNEILNYGEEQAQARVAKKDEKDKLIGSLHQYSFDTLNSFKNYCIAQFGKNRGKSESFNQCITLWSIAVSKALAGNDFVEKHQEKIKQQLKKLELYQQERKRNFQQNTPKSVQYLTIMLQAKLAELDLAELRMMGKWPKNKKVKEFIKRVTFNKIMLKKTFKLENGENYQSVDFPAYIYQELYNIWSQSEILQSQNKRMINLAIDMYYQNIEIAFYQFMAEDWYYQNHKLDSKATNPFLKLSLELGANYKIPPYDLFPRREIIKQQLYQRAQRRIIGYASAYFEHKVKTGEKKNSLWFKAMQETMIPKEKASKIFSEHLTKLKDAKKLADAEKWIRDRGQKAKYSEFQKLYPGVLKSSEFIKAKHRHFLMAEFRKVDIEYDNLSYGIKFAWTKGLINYSRYRLRKAGNPISQREFDTLRDINKMAKFLPQAYAFYKDAGVMIADNYEPKEKLRWEQKLLHVQFLLKAFKDKLSERLRDSELEIYHQQLKKLNHHIGRIQELSHGWHFYGLQMGRNYVMKVQAKRKAIEEAQINAGAEWWKDVAFALPRTGEAFAYIIGGNLIAAALYTPVRIIQGGYATLKTGYNLATTGELKLAEVKKELDSIYENTITETQASYIDGIRRGMNWTGIGSVLGSDLEFSRSRWYENLAAVHPAVQLGKGVGGILEGFHEGYIYGVRSALGYTRKEYFENLKESSWMQAGEFGFYTAEMIVGIVLAYASGGATAGAALASMSAEMQFVHKANMAFRMIRSASLMSAAGASAEHIYAWGSDKNYKFSLGKWAMDVYKGTAGSVLFMGSIQKASAILRQKHISIGTTQVSQEFLKYLKQKFPKSGVSKYLGQEIEISSLFDFTEAHGDLPSLLQKIKFAKNWKQWLGTFISASVTVYDTADNALVDAYNYFRKLTGRHHGPRAEPKFGEPVAIKVEKDGKQFIEDWIEVDGTWSLINTRPIAGHQAKEDSHPRTKMETEGETEQQKNNSQLKRNTLVAESEKVLGRKLNKTQQELLWNTHSNRALTNSEKYRRLIGKTDDSRELEKSAFSKEEARELMSKKLAGILDQASVRLPGTASSRQNGNSLISHGRAVNIPIFFPESSEIQNQLFVRFLEAVMTSLPEGADPHTVLAFILSRIRFIDHATNEKNDGIAINLGDDNFIEIYSDSTSENLIEGNDKLYVRNTRINLPKALLNMKVLIQKNSEDFFLDAFTSDLKPLSIAQKKLYGQFLHFFLVNRGLFEAEPIGNLRLRNQYRAFISDFLALGSYEHLPEMSNQDLLLRYPHSSQKNAIRLIKKLNPALDNREIATRVSIYGDAALAIDGSYTYQGNLITDNFLVECNADAYDLKVSDGHIALIGNADQTTALPLLRKLFVANPVFHPGLRPSEWSGVDPPLNQENMRLFIKFQELYGGNKRKLLLNIPQDLAPAELVAHIIHYLAENHPQISEGKPPKIIYVSNRNVHLQEMKDTFLKRFPFEASKVTNAQADGFNEGQVIFTTLRGLNNEIRKNMAKGKHDSKDYPIIIVDNFHRSAARTYQNMMANTNPEVFLGVTDVRDRLDAQSLVTTPIGNLIELGDIPLRRSVKEGYSAAPKMIVANDIINEEATLQGELIRENFAINHQNSAILRYNEQNPESPLPLIKPVSRSWIRTHSRTRLKLMVGHMKAYSSTQQQVWFCVDHEQIDRIRDEMLNQGIPVATYDSRTGDADRDDILNSFRAANYSQISEQERSVQAGLIKTHLAHRKKNDKAKFNWASTKGPQILLTHGALQSTVNVSNATTVVFAAQSSSPIVHTGRVAQGLSPYPGKPQTLFIDFLGNYSSLRDYLERGHYKPIQSINRESEIGNLLIHSDSDALAGMEIHIESESRPLFDAMVGIVNGSDPKVILKKWNDLYLESYGNEDVRTHLKSFEGGSGVLQIPVPVLLEFFADSSNRRDLSPNLKEQLTKDFNRLSQKNNEALKVLSKWVAGTESKSELNWTNLEVVSLEVGATAELLKFYATSKAGALEFKDEQKKAAIFKIQEDYKLNGQFAMNEELRLQLLEILKDDWNKNKRPELVRLENLVSALGLSLPMLADLIRHSDAKNILPRDLYDILSKQINLQWDHLEVVRKIKALKDFYLSVPHLRPRLVTSLASIAEVLGVSEAKFIEWMRQVEFQNMLPSRYKDLILELLPPIITIVPSSPKDDFGSREGSPVATNPDKKDGQQPDPKKGEKDKSRKETMQLDLFEGVEIPKKDEKKDEKKVVKRKSKSEEAEEDKKFVVDTLVNVLGDNLLSNSKKIEEIRDALELYELSEEKVGGNFSEKDLAVLLKAFLFLIEQGELGDLKDSIVKILEKFKNHNEFKISGICLYSLGKISSEGKNKIIRILIDKIKDSSLKKSYVAKYARLIFALDINAWGQLLIEAEHAFQIEIAKASQEIPGTKFVQIIINAKIISITQQLFLNLIARPHNPLLSLYYWALLPIKQKISTKNLIKKYQKIQKKHLNSFPSIIEFIDFEVGKYLNENIGATSKDFREWKKAQNDLRGPKAITMPISNEVQNFDLPKLSDFKSLFSDSANFSLEVFEALGGLDAFFIVAMKEHITTSELMNFMLQFKQVLGLDLIEKSQKLLSLYFLKVIFISTKIKYEIISFLIQNFKLKELIETLSVEMFNVIKRKERLTSNEYLWMVKLIKNKKMANKLNEFLEKTKKDEGNAAQISFRQLSVILYAQLGQVDRLDERDIDASFQTITISKEMKESEFQVYLHIYKVVIGNGKLRAKNEGNILADLLSNKFSLTQRQELLLFLKDNSGKPLSLLINLFREVCKDQDYDRLSVANRTAILGALFDMAIEAGTEKVDIPKFQKELRANVDHSDHIHPAIKMAEYIYLLKIATKKDSVSSLQIGMILNNLVILAQDLGIEQPKFDSEVFKHISDQTIDILSQSLLLISKNSSLKEDRPAINVLLRILLGLGERFENSDHYKAIKELSIKFKVKAGPLPSSLTGNNIIHELARDMFPSKNNSKLNVYERLIFANYLYLVGQQLSDPEKATKAGTLTRSFLFHILNTRVSIERLIEIILDGDTGIEFLTGLKILAGNENLIDLVILISSQLESELLKREVADANLIAALDLFFVIGKQEVIAKVLKGMKTRPRDAFFADLVYLESKLDVDHKSGNKKLTEENERFGVNFINWKENAGRTVARNLQIDYLYLGLLGGQETAFEEFKIKQEKGLFNQSELEYLMSGIQRGGHFKNKMKELDFMSEFRLIYVFYLLKALNLNWSNEDIAEELNTLKPAVYNARNPNDKFHFLVIISFIESALSDRLIDRYKRVDGLQGLLSVIHVSLGFDDKREKIPLETIFKIDNKLFWDLFPASVLQFILDNYLMPNGPEFKKVNSQKFIKLIQKIKKLISTKSKNDMTELLEFETKQEAEQKEKINKIVGPHTILRWEEIASREFIHGRSALAKLLAFYGSKIKAAESVYENNKYRAESVVAGLFDQFSDEELASAVMDPFLSAQMRPYIVELINYAKKNNRIEFIVSLAQRNPRSLGIEDRTLLLEIIMASSDKISFSENDFKEIVNSGVESLKEDTTTSKRILVRLAYALRKLSIGNSGIWLSPIVKGAGAELEKRDNILAHILTANKERLEKSLTVVLKTSLEGTPSLPDGWKRGDAIELGIMALSLGHPKALTFMRAVMASPFLFKAVEIKEVALIMAEKDRANFLAGIKNKSTDFVAIALEGLFEKYTEIDQWRNLFGEDLDVLAQYLYDVRPPFSENNQSYDFLAFMQMSAAISFMADSVSGSISIRSSEYKKLFNQFNLKDIETRGDYTKRLCGIVFPILVEIANFHEIKLYALGNEVIANEYKKYADAVEFSRKIAKNVPHYQDVDFNHYKMQFIGDLQKADIELGTNNHDDFDWIPAGRIMNFYFIESLIIAIGVVPKPVYEVDRKKGGIRPFLLMKYGMPFEYAYAQISSPHFQRGLFHFIDLLFPSFDSDAMTYHKHYLENWVSFLESRMDEVPIGVLSAVAHSMLVQAQFLYNEAYKVHAINPGKAKERLVAAIDSGLMRFPIKVFDNLTKRKISGSDFLIVKELAFIIYKMITIEIRLEHNFLRKHARVWKPNKVDPLQRFLWIFYEENNSVEWSDGILAIVKNEQYSIDVKLAAFSHYLTFGTIGGEAPTEVIDTFFDQYPDQGLDLGASRWTWAVLGVGMSHRHLEYLNSNNERVQFIGLHYVSIKLKSKNNEDKKKIGPILKKVADLENSNPSTVNFLARILYFGAFNDSFLAEKDFRKLFDPYIDFLSGELTPPGNSGFNSVLVDAWKIHVVGVVNELDPKSRKVKKLKQLLIKFQKNGLTKLISKMTLKEE